MNSFRELMDIINQSSPNDSEPDLDILKNLPIEISQIILSKLDYDSLLSCALVSHKWLSICKSKRSLRRKIRLHLRSKENVRNFNRSTTNSPSTSNRSIDIFRDINSSTSQQLLHRRRRSSLTKSKKISCLRL